MLTDVILASSILSKVRGDEKLYSILEFVTPNEEVIRTLSNTLIYNKSMGQAIVDAWFWVYHTVEYKLDEGEWWQYPLETLERGKGDCEDSASLLVSILRNYLGPDEIFVTVGDAYFQKKWQGHAWVTIINPESGNYIIEATKASEKKWLTEEEAKHYKPEIFFNDKIALERI